MATACQIYTSIYVQLSNELFPATSSDSIEIYTSKMPLKDYEELGFVSVQINKRKNSSVLPKLKLMASQKGANAIIQLHLNARYQGSFLVGTAVRWK